MFWFLMASTGPVSTFDISVANWKRAQLTLSLRLVIWRTQLVRKSYEIVYLGLEKNWVLWNCIARYQWNLCKTGKSLDALIILVEARKIVYIPLIFLGLIENCICKRSANIKALLFSIKFAKVMFNAQFLAKTSIKDEKLVALLMFS